MAEKMTAVVMCGVDDIRLEQVDVPKPGSGEALLKIAACGVCGSDLDRMYKKGPHKLPLITGHEFSAVVEEVGEGVTSVKAGDHVTVPPMLPCFKCGPCQQGHFSLCENYDYYGSRRHGAYAEYVCGPADLLLKVPDSLDLRAAAMVDPAAIALHAILRTKLTVGSRVAVTGGGGPIGLFAIQWARIMGASQVVSIDVTKEKIPLAKEAGADEAVSDWKDLEGIGGGFDVIIETSGARVVPDLAVSVLARHGELVLIGIPNADITISDSSWARLMRLEAAIMGSWNSFSAPFPGHEWRTAVEKLNSGDLKWEFMITHELGLDSVAETIRRMYNREIHSSKVIFMPEKTRQ